MRNFLLATLLISGCATTQVYKEPARSSYYLSCLQNGIMVTTCACMETKAIEESGLTDINAENQAQAVAAIQAAFPACQEATKKLLEETK